MSHRSLVKYVMTTAAESTDLVVGALRQSFSESIFDSQILRVNNMSHLVEEKRTIWLKKMNHLVQKSIMCWENWTCEGKMKSKRAKV